MNRFFPLFLILAAFFPPASSHLLAVESQAFNSETNTPDNGLVPDRDVHYFGSDVPQWKVTWDRARDLSRQEKLAEALVQYELLFLEKENIAAARWEYVSILLHLHRWQDAGDSLDLLLEVEPDKREYLLARAAILLETGSVEQAAELYGQLYERKPDSPDAVIALEGLIASLEKQGKHEVLLPLLDQLILRKPADVGLKKKAACHALEAGRPELALDLLHKVMNLVPEDVGLLRCMALSYEGIQKNDEAARSWQQIVEHLPGNSEAHLHLIKYYQETGNEKDEYFHLEQALKGKPDDPELLARIIDLSIQSDRADMALDYLAWYLSIRPDDPWGLTKKNQAEQILAQDFLILVENNGSRLLWRDLVTVTADRKGIYRAMAEILRKQNKERHLADVLLVLYEEDPGDEDVLMELQTLLLKQGRLDELAEVEDAKIKGSIEPHVQ